MRITHKTHTLFLYVADWSIKTRIMVALGVLFNIESSADNAVYWEVKKNK